MRSPDHARAFVVGFLAFSAAKYCELSEHQTNNFDPHLCERASSNNFARPRTTLRRCCFSSLIVDSIGLMVRLKVLNAELRFHRGFPERREYQADEDTKQRRGRLIRVQRHPLHTG